MGLRWWWMGRSSLFLDALLDGFVLTIIGDLLRSKMGMACGRLLLCMCMFSLGGRVGSGSDPRLLLPFCSAIGNACMMSNSVDDDDANAQLTLPRVA